MTIELEDLVIRKKYRVIPHTTLEIFEDEQGNYEATSAEDVRKALSDKIPPNGVQVKIGRNWFPVKRNDDNAKQHRQSYNYYRRRQSLKKRFIQIIAKGIQDNFTPEIIAVKLLKIHE